MRRITFVTGNAGKVGELRGLLPGIDIVQDVRGYPEIQADALAQVTEFGARHLIASGLSPPFLLEDSGLFVDALGGFPGVYSRNALDTVGCDGILDLLARRPDRTARFRTDLAFVTSDGIHHFEGMVVGQIATKAAGTGGFGFDPIFIPEGHDRTFAQMPLAQKQALSHRGQAVRRFVAAFETAKP